MLNDRSCQQRQASPLERADYQLDRPFGPEEFDQISTLQHLRNGVGRSKPHAVSRSSELLQDREVLDNVGFVEHPVPNLVRHLQAGPTGSYEWELTRNV